MHLTHLCHVQNILMHRFHSTKTMRCTELYELSPYSVLDKEDAGNSKGFFDTAFDIS